MVIPGWLVFLVVGAIAGWLAGAVMKGRGFGLVGNLIVGVLGALVGGFLFGRSYTLLGQILVAFVGALILLFLISLIKKA
jgi:uncharacterized membrane protein YeaQ/YmgE (transglycosylase-associated protein family)